jgi:hypothetical protein
MKNPAVPWCLPDKFFLPHIFVRALIAMSAPSLV